MPCSYYMSGSARKCGKLPVGTSLHPNPLMGIRIHEAIALTTLVSCTLGRSKAGIIYHKLGCLEGGPDMHVQVSAQWFIG